MNTRGGDFVNGILAVPNAVIYDGRRLRYSGEQVHIRACLGRKFSYKKLMGR